MKNPFKRYSKINPQREDGNRQINTEILLQIIKLELTAAEMKIIFAIIHKTWGFNKKSDTISVSQLMEITGLVKRTVNYCLKDLKSSKIIHFQPSKRVHRGSPLNEYLFNKHYDTWKLNRISRNKKGALPCKKRVNGDAPTIETSTIEKKTSSPAKKPGPKLLKEMDQTCERLYQEKIFDKAHVFRNSMLKSKMNPQAILYTLNECLKMGRRKKLPDPFAYCMSIIKRVNGNYNEAEHRERTAGLKQSMDKIIAAIN
jgi:phage replication O-like protein O